MKLKKIALNAVALEHSEMKKIKAGRDYEGYECHDAFDPSEEFGVRCSTSSGVSSCMSVEGTLGKCGLITISVSAIPKHTYCGCLLD